MRVGAWLLQYLVAEITMPGRLPEQRCSPRSRVCTERVAGAATFNGSAPRTSGYSRLQERMPRDARELERPVAIFNRVDREQPVEIQLQRVHVA